MYEEEDCEQDCRNDVGHLEELIRQGSQWTERGECKPCLSQYRNDTSPIDNGGRPLEHHVALPDVEDNEGKRVDQS